VDGPQGLNIDVSYHREKQEWLEKQRNKDYNEYLKKVISPNIPKEYNSASCNNHIPNHKTLYTSIFFWHYIKH
jgi:hypothetical protein